MNKKDLKESLVQVAFLLLYKAHHWHTKQELRKWSIKELKEIITELEENKKKGD